MVSIGEARQQLQSQQRQVATRIKQIEATKLQTLTRKQLARATPQTQTRFKAEIPKRQAVLEKAKKEAISRVKEFERTKLGGYEKEIQKAERKQEVKLKELKWARRKEKEKESEKRRVYKEQQEDISKGKLVVTDGKIIEVSKLKEAGYIPSYSNGKLVGVIDPYLQMSVGLKDLGRYLEETQVGPERTFPYEQVQVSPFESQLPAAFQAPPISDFEKAMGKTFQGVPLVSDVKTGLIRPAYEVAPPTFEVSKKREFFELIRPKIEPTMPEALSFLTYVPPEPGVPGLGPRGERWIKKIKPYIEKIAPVIPLVISPPKAPIITPLVKKGVEEAIPYIEKGIEYIEKYPGVRPSIPKLSVLEYTPSEPGWGERGEKWVKPYVAPVVATIARGLKEQLKLDKEMFQSINEELIQPGVKITVEQAKKGYDKVKDLIPKGLKEEWKSFKSVALGDQGGVKRLIEDIKEVKRTEEEILQPEARKILEEIKFVGEEIDFEKQAKLIKSLKEKGVKFDEVIDPETGEVVLDVKLPKWFETLRPGFEKKKEKETFSSFFFRKQRKGVGETFAELRQRIEYKGPTIFEPEKEVTILPHIKKFGERVAVGAELAAFAVPGVREYMFFGGIAEAALRGPKPFVSFVKEEPLEVGVAALGVGLAAFKGVRYLKTPIVTKMPKPTPIISVGKDVLRPVKYGGITIDKGIYQVTTTIPARKAEVITRFGKIIGRKPKIIDITKPATYVAYSPVPIDIIKGKIVQPAYFWTQRIGKRAAGYVTVSKLAGKSIPRNLEAFNKLSKTEQYTWQQLVSSITGRPVALKNVPKMIKDSQITQKAIVEAERLYRLSPAKMQIRGFAPGRAKTLQEVVVIAEKIPQPVGSEVQAFKTMVGAKDITKPFARAAGEVPIISGKTLRLPTKELRDVFTILPSETATRARFAIDVSKKAKEVSKFVDLSKTLSPADDIIKQITQAEQAAKRLEQIKKAEQAAKLVSKEISPAVTTWEAAKAIMIKSTIKHPKPIIPTAPPIPTSLELAPRMVGGLGYGVSEYTGPVYAPIEEVITPIEKLPDGVTIIPETRIKLDTDRVLVPRIDTGLRAEVLLDVGIKQVQVPKQVQIPKMVQVPKLITIPRTVQIPKVTQVIKPVQITKQVSITKAIQIPKVIPRPITITKQPIPKIPEPIIPFFLPSAEPVRRKRPIRKPRPRKPVFTSEVRRKGKWVAIGKFKTKKGAKAIGKRRTRRTAVASFRVKKNGKIVELKPSKLFREAKKEPGILVQKKTKRILSRGEKREISLIGARAAKAKRAKKKAKKKSKKRRKNG